MRKYPMIFDGNTHYASHIGANHLASDVSFGGIASSYNHEFDNEDLVRIESGLGDIRYCTIGDISEAYKILKEEIIAKKPHNLQSYCECVQNVVLRYFGDYTNVETRLSYYPSEEDIDLLGQKLGKVSDIAHKNAAMCVERAMLSQNLLSEIGIKSFFKISGIISNGNEDVHAYNLVEYDGKYYVFDATIPTILNDKVSPLICEIPKDVFEKMSRPESDYGVSVEVSHYNPLQRKDYEITYDAGRKEIYRPEESYTKG